MAKRSWRAFSSRRPLLGTAPIIAEGIRAYSNPLPHVLILTAIVVGVATTALGLAMVVRIHEEYGTVDEAEIQRQDDDE